MEQSEPQSDRATAQTGSMTGITPPAPTRISHHHHRHHAGNGGDASSGSSLPSTAAHAPAEPALPQRRELPNLTTEAQEERLFLQGDFAPRKKPRRRRQRRDDGASPASIKGQTVRRRSRRRPDPHPDTATQAARGIRERVLHFTPSWFAVTMGTGVIATLVNLLPWTATHSGFRWVALVYLLADIVIFLLFTAAFLTRYILFPQVLPLTIKHPQKSMFLGTFPMGMIVIISNIAQLGTVEFQLGHSYAMAASVLWWIATVISLMTAIGVPFMVTTYQSHSFSSTTAALLLPIVPPITVAAVGAVIAEALMDVYPTYAFTIVIVSYLVLGVGLPLALLILVLYFQRLLLFKQPPREVIISVFLPLGPAGQGGEALLHLGLVAYRLFPTISALPSSEASSVGNQLTYAGASQLGFPVGQALFAAGLLGALMLWAFGMWWMALGIMTVIRETRRGKLTFNMGWWGATFPLGSLAICTGRLALVLSSLALKIVYTILVILTLLVWFTVAIPTLKGFLDGSLLTRKAAPCIADLPLEPLKRRSAEEEDEWGEEEEEDGSGSADLSTSEEGQQHGHGHGQGEPASKAAVATSTDLEKEKHSELAGGDVEVSQPEEGQDAKGPGPGPAMGELED